MCGCDGQVPNAAAHSPWQHWRVCAATRTKEATQPLKLRAQQCEHLIRAWQRCHGGMPVHHFSMRRPCPCGGANFGTCFFRTKIMCSKSNTQNERRPGNHSPTHRTNSMITPVCHAIVFKAVWHAKPAQPHSASLPDGCCGKAMPSTCLSGVREGA